MYKSVSGGFVPDPLQNNRNGSVIRFGDFEFRPGAGELRKHGLKVKLQGKPLQLLEALLEHPGEVVPREKLRERLWAADTFVDFESGLNTAVNRLRLALGDSADRPRYIGTLARNGYQFLAQVSAVPSQPFPPVVKPRKYGHWLMAAAALLFLASGLLLSLRRGPPALPVFHQITFRRLRVEAARFAPDGESVIYAGGDRGQNGELFLASTLSPESRSLGFPGATLASVSRSGELALITYGNSSVASLMRVPMNGGAPLPLDRNVCCADWSPDGANLAAIRPGLRHATLDFPLGHTIFHSTGWISDIRVSPSGKEVAFIDHLVRGDDGGNVVMVDANGVAHTLAAGWASADGLAWAPSGREVWFTAARTGLIRALYAVNLAGKLRQAAAIPGTLRLLDISRAGRVLISREQTRAVMTGMFPGDTKEKDLSWFDYSRAVDISDDGRVILFDETGEGGGTHHAVYIRKTGASNAVRIGEGFAMALSADGTAALTMSDNDQTRMTLAPLTPGRPRTISGQGVKYDSARFFPDGRTVLVGGRMSDGPLRLYIQPVDGGKPVPVDTAAYLVRPAISPDGSLLAGVDTQDRLILLPTAGGQPKVLATGFPAKVARFGRSGKYLITQSAALPLKIQKVDVTTGRVTPWKEIEPADVAGVMTPWPVVVSADERTLVYSFQRSLSELFVVDGLITSPRI